MGFQPTWKVHKKKKMMKGGEQYINFFENDEGIQSVTQAITQKKEMHASFLL